MRRIYRNRETGAVKKSWTGKITVALVFPNTYALGMSNLGFHKLYHLFNTHDHVVCERVFLPDGGKTDKARSVESGRSLEEFHIIAFSVSFESDFVNILQLLRRADLPIYARDRHPPHPLILAGGAALMLNPEPVAPFLDAVVIGEAENILSSFLKAFNPDEDREKLLLSQALSGPGFYVPSFYKTSYLPDGRQKNLTPLQNVPPTIRRAEAADINQSETRTTVFTPDTVFGDTVLVETGRGCPHGCRFCGAGYIYRPPRFRDTDQLKTDIDEACVRGETNKVGLVGAAVSDHPHIGELCRHIRETGLKASFSSLRADMLSDELVETMKASGVKTATIAPEAGSERMRRVINKHLTEDLILSAVDKLVFHGIINVKLYFMIGLPTETEEDVFAVLDLSRKIKSQFLETSRKKGKIGSLTLSVNPFIPKPFTPFQRVGMDTYDSLRQKFKILKNGIKKIPNARLQLEDVKKARVQALLSRGDRRASLFLETADKNRGNFVKTMKEFDPDPEFFITRERGTDEYLPWEFIDHGLSPSFLDKEYKRALTAQNSPDCPMETDRCRLCGVCGR